MQIPDVQFQLLLLLFKYWEISNAEIWRNNFEKKHNHSRVIREKQVLDGHFEYY